MKKTIMLILLIAVAIVMTGWQTWVTWRMPCENFSDGVYRIMPLPGRCVK